MWQSENQISLLDSFLDMVVVMSVCMYHIFLLLATMGFYADDLEHTCASVGSRKTWGLTQAVADPCCGGIFFWPLCAVEACTIHYHWQSC